MKRHIFCVIALIVTINLSACGYLLYPDRVGNKSGRMDPAVLVLDGVGLLFGIIPGVIAFAVDISQGTIYMAPGEKSIFDQSNATELNNQSDLEWVDINEFVIDSAKLTKNLSASVGHSINIDDIQYYQLKNKNAVIALNKYKLN